MKFSQRVGINPSPSVLLPDEMPKRLQNRLWNMINLYIWKSENRFYQLDPFFDAFFTRYLGNSFTAIPNYTEQKLSVFEQIFMQYKWYEVYDFLEFLYSFYSSTNLEDLLNHVLNDELSPYRIVSGIVTKITEKMEIEALTEVLNDKDFPGVQKHIKTALELLSRRDNPDYRNSIKESISAVESMAKVITGNESASLGDAIKILEKKIKLHSALKEGFLKLYGYTSNADGIRHGMMDEPDLGPEDAKYFLLSCTSFINYLKSKI